MTTTTTTQERPLGQELRDARARLRKQRDRVRYGLWVEAVGVAALLLIAYALSTLLVDRLLRLEWAFRAGLLLVFVAAVARVFVRRLLRPMRVHLSDEELALAVERQCPQLDQQLISSLQRNVQAADES